MTETRYLSVNQLAEAFGLKPRRVYWLIEHGVIRAERHGGRIRVRVERLMADIAEAHNS
ncbi:MAG: helix-turn-helix domain-containing protein [Faecousia sp.]